MRLSYKQKAFLEHYLHTWNASEAATRAGYSKAPHVTGSTLLSKLSIQTAIRERLEQLHITANETLAIVGEVARGPMRYFLDEHGRPDLDTEIARKHYHLLKAVEYNEDERIDKDGNRVISRKIKVTPRDADAMTALLMKHHGLLSEQVPVQQNNTLIINSAQELMQQYNLNPQDVLAEIPAIIQSLGGGAATGDTTVPSTPTENNTENVIDTTE